jgi:hypothetical protein
MNKIKLNKCNHEWSSIEDRRTNNFCKHCEICVPDLSNKSNSEVAEVIDQYTCARFHERHLAEHQSKYFFINLWEKKMEQLGYFKLTASLVLVYLFIVGCGHRGRTVGAYAEYINHDKRQKAMDAEYKAVKKSTNKVIRDVRRGK